MNKGVGHFFFQPPFFDQKTDEKTFKKWSYRWSEPFGKKSVKTLIFVVIFWFL